MTAWLDFCDAAGTGPLQARRVHVDAWARAMQAAGAASRTVARRLAAGTARTQPPAPTTETLTAQTIKNYGHQDRAGGLPGLLPPMVTGRHRPRPEHPRLQREEVTPTPDPRLPDSGGGRSHEASRRM